MLIDLVILLILVFAAIRGFRRGLLEGLIDLVALILSVILAAYTYRGLAEIIVNRFKVFPTLAQLLAFSLIWFLVEAIYYVFVQKLWSKPMEAWKKVKWNEWGGLVLESGKTLVFITLGLMLLASLPMSQKKIVTSALTPRILLGYSNRWQHGFDRLIGRDLSDALNFLTVKPQSQESIKLGFTTSKIKIDTVAEEKMLRLINRDRVAKGLPPLVGDLKLQQVARAHASDMFVRGYFSHVNLDGKDPFARMRATRISFITAGENIALSPNVDLAHVGLMNSPGHRANILAPEFNRVGIGVIDGGAFGEMFAQEFSN